MEILNAVIQLLKGILYQILSDVVRWTRNCFRLLLGTPGFNCDSLVRDSPNGTNIY